MQQQNRLVTFILRHKLVSFLTIAILIIGSVTLINRPSAKPTNQQKSATPSSQTKTSSVTKSGSLVCIVMDEKKHPNVCTKSLKADDGKYYTLQEKDSKNPLIRAAYTSRIQVSGTLTVNTSNKNDTYGGTITVEKYGEIL